MRAQVEIGYMKSFYVGHVDYFQHDDETTIEAIARMIRNVTDLVVRSRNIKIISLAPSDDREVILNGMGLSPILMACT